MMAEHTKGRLSQCGIALRDEQGRLLGGISGCQIPNVGRANARRLVACWNALEGISTEALEQGMLEDLIADVRKILDRDSPVAP